MSCLQEVTQPTTPDKSFIWRYTGIYKHLLSQCFQNVVLGRLEMVQCKCFSRDQQETCLLENF